MAGLRKGTSKYTRALATRRHKRAAKRKAEKDAAFWRRARPALQRLETQVDELQRRSNKHMENGAGRKEQNGHPSVRDETTTLC